jgi:outer membrane protein TolC
VQTRWTAFQDPLLDALVADAVTHNDDLKVATANSQSARASRLCRLPARATQQLCRLVLRANRS